jgi:putative ABC transport system permease protein
LNTAIFSVFNAVLLRPLSYPNANRLVSLSPIAQDGEAGVVTGPEFNDWRAGVSSFDSMVAYVQRDETIGAPDGLARVRVAAVTHEFWEVSGAVPASGRLPLPDETGVALVTQAFVRRQFAQDPNVVGKSTTLAGRPVTIVGVLPEEFGPQLPRSPFPGFLPKEVDIYRPMRVSSARSGPIQLFNVLARLRPGATLAGARAELETIRRRSAESQPNPSPGQPTLRLIPLHEQVAGSVRIALQVLLAAVALVLLIACANAANLFLVRGSARKSEMAVRLSLGASRSRLFTPMLVESVLLVAVGSALGLFVSRITLESIHRIHPQAIPRFTEVTVDSRVIGALLVASMLTAAVCSLVPAIAVWRTDLHHALKRGLASTSVSGMRTASVLVAGQVALALILIVSAGLMVKTVWLLNQHPPGFMPDRVLTARFEFNGPGRFDPNRMVSFAETLLGRLKGEPWVNAASISGHGYSLTRSLNVDGREPRNEEQLAARPPILINSTSPELPRVMSLRMARGRWFAEHEAAAVLNESVARREFAGEDPLGRRIKVSEQGPWLTIVGIIADRKFSKLDAAPEPEVYVPYAVAGDGLFGFTALVLTNGDDALAHAATFRHLATRLDPNQVADQLMSLEQALSQSIAPRRLNLLLLGAFAAASLILAIVGVYGVMSHTVSRRVREIGVRMSVGAQRAHVVAMVLRQGMFVVSCGIAAGIAIGLTLMRAIQNLLYEVQATDLPTFAVAIIGIVSATLVACGVPAARAARVDPTVALRDE